MAGAVGINCNNDMYLILLLYYYLWYLYNYSIRYKKKIFATCYKSHALVQV